MNDDHRTDRSAVTFSEDEYELELSEADIERLSRSLTIAAHRILQLEGEDGAHAAEMALELREDIQRQRREQKYELPDSSFDIEVGRDV